MTWNGQFRNTSPRFSSSETTTPCFNFRSCGNQATMEKAGKTLCASCAEAVRGQELPLRPPSWKRGSELNYFD